METYGITKTIIHPQWGAPMNFHRIVRVEVDMGSISTHILFNSYYDKTTYENGSSSMSNTSIYLDESKLLTGQELVQAIIDTTDNDLSGGELYINVPDGGTDDEFDIDDPDPEEELP